MIFKIMRISFLGHSVQGGSKAMPSATMLLVVDLENTHHTPPVLDAKHSIKLVLTLIISII